jgi:TP901 family phage tail tape measure protein
MADKVVGFRITLAGEQEALGKMDKITDSIKESYKALLEMKKGGEAFNQVRYDALIAEIAKTKNAQKELTAEIRTQQKAFEQTKVAIGSYRDLDLQLQKLRQTYRELNEAGRKSTEGLAILRDIAGLDRELKKIDASMGQYQRNVGNYASAFGKIAPMVRNLAGDLGVITSVSEVVQANAKTSDSLADIGRVSQLSKTQVAALYEELKNVQSGGVKTRTSTEDLLGIAIVGGKLGVAEKELISFTKAADALKVGLGGELGQNVEETVTKLGKLANIFSAEGDKNITGDKLLNIGNAIAYLANKGVATGEFLSDFSQRLAGLSGIADITLPQTLGLGAGFEELGQSAEVASTATTQLILKIGQDVPKYAKLAGKSTEEFAQTVEKRPVEALIQLSEGLTKNKTGFAEIAESFKEAEARGVRVGATLGVLGKNADFFRGKIEEGTKAYESQNIILDAYKEKNETAGASLDRLKKTVIDIATSTEFQTWLSRGLEGVTKFIQILAGLPKLLSENKTEFIALALAIAALNGEQIRAQFELIKLSNAYKFLTDATERQRIVTELLGKAQKALPLIAVIAVVYAAVKAYEIYNSKLDAAKISAESLANAQGQIADEAAREQASISASFNTLKSDIESKEKKKAAIDSLLKQYPDYLRGIDLEKASVQQLTTIQNGLNDSILRSVASRIKQQELDKIGGEIIKRQLRASQLSGGAEITIEDSQKISTGDVEGNVFKDENRRSAIIKKINGEVDELNKALQKTGNDFDKAFGTDGGQKKTGRDAVEDERDDSRNAKIVEKEKELSENESKADAKRRDRAAKDLQKETSERIKYEEQAAERISQLRKNLVDKTFDLQKGEAAAVYTEGVRKAQFERDNAIKKLSGTAENVANEKALYNNLYSEEEKLIKLNLAQKIDALNKAKAAAVDAAQKELAAARQNLTVQAAQNTLKNIRASGAVDTRLSKVDEVQASAQFTEKESALRAEYAKKTQLTDDEENELTEKLKQLATDRETALLEIRKKAFELTKIQKTNELTAQVVVLENQRDKELTDIDDRESAKREKLDGYLRQGLISNEEYQQSLKDIEAVAIEERAQTDIDFQNAKAEFAQTTVLDYLNEQQAIADREVQINADKNEKLKANEKRTADEKRAIQEAQLDFLGVFVTGAKDLLGQDEKNRKKYSSVFKALALAEIAINLQRQISNIAVGISKDTSKFGVIGTAISTTAGAIQVGIAVAQAGFAAAKVISQQFEYGGIEPNGTRGDGILAVEGGQIPSESGVIHGRAHANGGVKVLNRHGNLYEVEGGEYRLRNGRETYIINKRATAQNRTELDTLSSLIRPSIFDPKRKMAAAAINASTAAGRQSNTSMAAKNNFIVAATNGYAKMGKVKMPKFESGGVIVENGSSAIFDTYLLQAPSTARPSNIVVNNIQQTDETAYLIMAKLEQLISATNSRVDNIRVINNPTDALNAANDAAELKAVQTL